MSNKRKMVNHVIHYFEKGVEHKIPLQITFSSQWVQNQFISLIGKTEKAKEQLKELTEFGQEVRNIKSEKAEGYKEKLKEMSKEQESLERMCIESTEDIEKTRMELLKQFLDDNGIDKPELLDKDFWLKKTSPAELNNFLESTVFKDSEKKNLANLLK